MASKIMIDLEFEWIDEMQYGYTLVNESPENIQIKRYKSQIPIHYQIPKRDIWGRLALTQKSALTASFVN